MLFSPVTIAAVMVLTISAGASDEPPSTAFLKAFDESGTLVVDVKHEARGETAWEFIQDARDAGKLDFTSRFLGPVPVVYTLNGVTMDLQTVGWCVSKIESGGEEWPNVGLKEVAINPGDVLQFELLKMGTFPSRREEKQPTEDVDVTSEGEDDEL